MEGRIATPGKERVTVHGPSRFGIDDGDVVHGRGEGNRLIATRKLLARGLGLVLAQEFAVGIDLDFVPVAVGVEGGPEVVAHLLHSVSGWRLESVNLVHVSEGERSVDDDVVGSQSTFL